MLHANVIMFSRSLTLDYRWIYSGSFINEMVGSTMLNDYEELKKNKGMFLKEKHLIVRRLHEKVLIYKFCETEDTDQNSRTIYALVGMVLSGFDFKIFEELFQYILSYIYEEFDVLFGKYQKNIPEKSRAISVKMNFSLDVVVEYFRINNIILPKEIKEFVEQCSANDLIIKNGGVERIPWKKITEVKNGDLKLQSEVFSEKMLYCREKGKGAVELNELPKKHVNVQNGNDMIKHSISYKNIDSNHIEMNRDFSKFQYNIKEEKSKVYNGFDECGLHHERKSEDNLVESKENKTKQIFDFWLGKLH